jgi:hypothetical protein
MTSSQLRSTWRSASSKRRNCSSRSPRGIHSRSRSGRGSRAASHCCDGRSFRGCRTGRGCVSGLPRCSASISCVGHVVGHLAQPVHVVAERDQPGRRAAGQLLIGAADQVVRSTSWNVPICGRPEGRSRSRRSPARRHWGLPSGPALEQLARLLVRPGLDCIAAERMASAVKCVALLFSRGQGRGSGRSFASSRASRNPCRNLDRRSGGEVREATRGEAIARAAETPHIMLNAPLVGQRLGYAELSGLDLLELFAFIHPARFAVPTPAGLSRARLASPARRSRGGGGASARIAAALLDTLGDPRLARARGGLDRQCEPPAARLELGAARRPAAGAAGTRRADALLAA